MSATRRTAWMLAPWILAMCVPCAGQEARETDWKSRVTVVRAARMLDVRSGRITEDPHVWVADGRIRAVYWPDEHSVPIEFGATYLDLGDVTLVPGLIDCHTHLTGTLEGDFVHRSVHEGPADAALRGARHALLTLQAGFTTVRDLGSAGFADVALMRAIERGDVPGPRIVPAGHSIGISGGHGDETGFRPGILVGGPEQGIADGPDECRKAVRLQLNYGAKVIKCVATAGVLSFEPSVGAQQLSREELEAIVDEARRHGVKVAAHAHGAEGILAAVLAGVDSIEHGSLLDDRCIAAMKERGTYLVPTTYLADAIDLANLPPPLREKAERILPLARENLAKAIAAGVKIAYGTDAAVYPHGQNARELDVLVRLGMSPIEAIRSATVNAADLLGVDDRGEIARGKLADLIAVPGNPLENVRALEHVRWLMLGGRVVDLPAPAEPPAPGGRLTLPAVKEGTGSGKR
ncbi:MAG TPA: amidohydrolase family protein [Planctomycetota bacterium]|nr:amidohydrolase family protein [Planctomycetota bacterium]